MTKKILIIDNNIDDVKNLSVILQQSGFLIDIADSSNKIIEKISSFEPDLILLDALMPQEDGLELCKLIKDDIFSKEIPIIFITEFIKPENLEKAYDYGAIDYIKKPFLKEELIARVKNQFQSINQNKIIKKQLKELTELNNEKNGIIELTVHDLKNPLQAIIGYSDVLINKLTEKEQLLLNYLHSIKSSAQKAVSIIKDLNEVNTIESGNLTLYYEKFDVREVLLKNVEDYLFSAESKKQIIIYEEYEDELFVNSDKIKMARIFDNLISNAVKYSESNKKIYVKCDLITEHNAKLVKIIIKDEGPGFTKEDLKKIYGKFAKLSARPTSDECSTGLGLSIVKKLTELLEGSLELKSSVGKGAEFILKFKLIQ